MLVQTIMLFLGITAGTMIATSSHHWLVAWAGLELNTLAVLPMISKTKHPRAIEASTKYFLSQAIASCLLLTSSIINAWQTGSWDITQMANKHTTTMMTIALAMKSGLAPFHFWFPEVMQGSTLDIALLMSTWQKLAPMILFYSTSNHIQPTTALILGILSSTLGGWGGMNQTQLRKMMAYSSISNMGWALMVFTSEPNTSTINVVIYITIMIPTFLLMTTLTTKTLQNLSESWTTSPSAATALLLLLLSTAGLPPLTGFLPKLLILKELMTQNFTPVAVIISMTSLLNLTFYLRTAYLTTLLNPPTSTTSMMKWRHTLNSTKWTLTAPTSVMSTTALPSAIP
uniref:NADH-ubiquinone oxidoreductase chain 2 n=1 Tax=Ptyctolaemus collicristatus TaxID=282158 RepID=Q6E5N2_9SAUR|nr:NADH dehydrogenase subunit 2 [Ptyctolaemus collicristatus]